MFEKLKEYFEKGKSMLEEAFVESEEDTFVTVPEGVTCEQLIEEAKQYVDAIIVHRHGEEQKEEPETEESDTGDTDDGPDEDTDEQEG